jgi:dihydrofolate reductase
MPKLGMTILSLILARATNGVIGKNNALPWHLPADMAHFKKITVGKPVIMGRKTWDSLPQKFRPLPGRRNIVVTRDGTWAQAGAERATSLTQALQFCQSEPEACVIGGAQIYVEALPLARRVYLTEIDYPFDGDTHFAPLDATQWREASRQTQHRDGNPAFNFSFVVYERIA